MFGRRESQPNEHLTDELLSAYIDEQVTAAERAQVEAHLVGCPSCAGELRALQATVGLLREMPPVPLPRAFTIPADAPVRRARGAVRGTSLWDTLTRGWGYRALQGATALAMALLMTLCVGDLLLRPLPVMTPMAAAPAPAAPTMPLGEGLRAVAPTSTPAPSAYEVIGQATATGRVVAVPTQPSEPTRPPAPAGTPAPKAGPETPTLQAAAGALAETATPCPSPPALPAGTSRPARPPASPTPRGEELARATAPPSTAATPVAREADAAATTTPTGAAPTAVVRYYQPPPVATAEPESVVQPQFDLVRLAVCGIEGVLLAVVMGLLVVTGIAWFVRRRSR